MQEEEVVEADDPQYGAGLLYCARVSVGINYDSLGGFLKVLRRMFILLSPGLGSSPQANLSETVNRTEHQPPRPDSIVILGKVVAPADTDLPRTTSLMMRSPGITGKTCF